MSFGSLLSIEMTKIRRSKILLILFAAVIILWLPSIINVDMNFHMQAEGIAPEHNFLIQGLLGMSWFMFPASMVVSTVLLIQTERKNKGILKMLALPIPTAKLCLAKFTVLLILSAVQVLMTMGMYYISAVVVTGTTKYDFILPPLFVLKEAGLFLLAAIPMLAVFWMISVCIQTPIFAMGIGLASLVPSILAINSKLWFIYPMAYPFFVVTAEYGQLATKLSTSQIELIPWLPVAVILTITGLVISCCCFGQAERR